VIEGLMLIYFILLKQLLTDNAKKRLEAIQEFSDLGSGFRLAMRDLEIKGAGNLLGNEQTRFLSVKLVLIITVSYWRIVLISCSRLICCCQLSGKRT
jgi:RecG-like helicase